MPCHAWWVSTNGVMMYPLQSPVARPPSLFYLPPPIDRRSPVASHRVALLIISPTWILLLRSLTHSRSNFISFDGSRFGRSVGPSVHRSIDRQTQKDQDSRVAAPQSNDDDRQHNIQPEWRLIRFDSIRFDSIRFDSIFYSWKKK